MNLVLKILDTPQTLEGGERLITQSDHGEVLTIHPLFSKIVSILIVIGLIITKQINE